MILAWWAGLALAASPKVSADIVVTRAIAADPSALYDEVFDLGSWSSLFPEPCATDWQLGPATSGPGATAEVTYHFGPVHRSLDLTIARAEPGLLIQAHHAGKLGFDTQWIFRADPAGGTEVTLTTPLYEPPWPLRKVFRNEVVPAWRACYAQALERLSASG